VEKRNFSMHVAADALALVADEWTMA